MSGNYILDNLESPEILEQNYRLSPERFESELEEAIRFNADSETLKVWQARLNYSPSVTSGDFSLSLLVSLCLLSGFLAKVPALFDVSSYWYLPRFVPLIVITSLILYFLITSSNQRLRTIIVTTIAGCTAYLLLLPGSLGSASVTMALVHIPLFCLSLLAVSFMSDKWNSVEARIEFIGYVGETVIYAALILIGGMVLTGITLGLFSLIDLSIEKWYLEYVVVLGLVSSPLVATYLYDKVQQRKGKFAPILSNVFSPLFLITILVYLGATLYQGKSPFTDRDFLIHSNGLLLVLLGLTIFSITGKRRADSTQTTDYINVLLVGATLIINITTLSAILFRWLDHGATVNRIVVSGANILIFIHLTILLTQYIKHLRMKTSIDRLKAAITNYLPVYTGWSLIVSTLIPLAFQFK